MLTNTMPEWGNEMRAMETEEAARHPADDAIALTELLISIKRLENQLVFLRAHAAELQARVYAPAV